MIKLGIKLGAVRKIIHKETDNDLVDEIKGYFTKMASAQTIESFLLSGSDAIDSLNRLRSGNEKATGRVWSGKIWNFIETTIKKSKSSRGKMMAVLTKADSAGNWHDKLSVYGDDSMIKDKHISSRWNEGVRKAARDADNNINKLVKEFFQNPEKVDNPITPLREHLADFFCKTGESLKLNINGRKIESRTKLQTTSIPILPLNDETLNTYGGEAFYKFIKKACNLSSCVELKVNDKEISVNAIEELPDKDKIIGFITPGVISVLKLMANDNEDNEEENKVEKLTKEIVEAIDKKVEDLKKPQNNNV